MDGPAVSADELGGNGDSAISASVCMIRDFDAVTIAGGSGFCLCVCFPENLVAFGTKNGRGETSGSISIV